jgi:hypothetical protein
MEMLLAERILSLELEEMMGVLEKLNRDNPDIIQQLQEAIDDL